MAGSLYPDPVSIEIIRNAFISAAREMNFNLIRGAYSEVIYEMQDSSVGLFDHRGNLLGQSPGLPVFLGILEVAVRVVTEAVGSENFHRGDVFVVNDAVLTGSHLNDLMVLAPLFYEGELFGFSVAKAHFADIGAMDPGETNDATEIYQEGYRLGPLKIISAGEPRDDVIDLLTRNSRLSRQAYGDLWAMIAACRTGETRLQELLERFGMQGVRAASESVFAQCEKLDREAVQAIPDGIYQSSGYLDNDRQSDKPVSVKVSVQVKGDEMSIDLSGSNPQTQGCLNCGFPATVSVARLAFKFIINPQIAVTGGTFRNLHIKAEKGSIFHAEEPAACQYYYPHLGLMIDMIFQALAPVIPEKVIASQCADAMNIMFTGHNPRSSETFISGEATAVGWGAHEGHDGENGMINYGGGDLKNFPVEVMESRFPLLIWKYGLLPDSGGAGRWRGGLAIEREYETLSDSLLSLWFERTRTPGLGILGGSTGSTPRVLINPGSESERSVLKVSSLPVSSHTIVNIRTGGGGGYGNPAERDPAKIEEDLADGYVTLKAVKSDYCFAENVK